MRKFYLKVTKNEKVIEHRLFDNYLKALTRLASLVSVARQGLLEFDDIQLETIEDIEWKGTRKEKVDI